MNMRALEIREGKLQVWIIRMWQSLLIAWLRFIMPGGNYQEAEPLIGRTLRIYEQSLGRSILIWHTA